MRLYPAVDILDNKAVRLLFGNRSNLTVYGEPCELAARWEAQGAEILHIVDLNGAFDDSDVNKKVIKNIVKAAKIPVQVGGGVKSLDRVKYCVEELGAKFVVIGTAAALNPALIDKAFGLYGDKIVCGIDVKDGKVSIKGWVEQVDLTAKELAQRVKSQGVKRIVFTDISRDGALTGVNIPATVALQSDTGTEVIASGGVRSEEDIINLKCAGVFGAILGRALYTGDLSLQNALKFAR
jgi:phosphoribosylformimino-5-aminoimidazole carboxamide ribotide isomerase